MNKDAFYFPHFSNARHDRKLRRVRKQLGIEGYAIYFMLLEVLREQEEFKYPLQDVDLLADDFNTSEEKVKTVITGYNLFQTDEKNFFSYKFNEFLKPYLDGKQRKRISGIKGNLIKYNRANKEDLDKLTDAEIIELNDRIAIANKSHSDRCPSQSKVKESKVKEKKVKESKDIKERKKDFAEKLAGFKETYSSELLRAFYEYWTEHGENDKKMRFEKEKSYDIKRRLATWKNREKNFKPKNDIPTVEEQWQGKGKGLRDKYDWEYDPDFRPATPEELGIEDMPF